MSVASPVVLNWNGPERRIYIKQGITEFHWMDDIYKEYRNERRLNEDFRKYNAFMIASGNEAKGGGKATPRLVKLLEDVKVICWDENIEITVGGEAITDNADVDPTLYDNSTRTNPLIINYQPPAAEVIVVDAIVNNLDYGGIVNYDENNVDGVGQAHPVGTTANPVNNIPDMLAIVNLYHLSIISTVSNMTITQDLEKFTITGKIPDCTIFSSGYKLDLCKIVGLDINGNFAGSNLHLVNCDVYQALNIQGQMKNCFHNGVVSIVANGILNMADCESGISGQVSPEVDMQVGVDTFLSCRAVSGGLTITNCDTAACVATLEFIAGKAHLEPSCSDGYLSVRGVATIDDRSTGTTVDTTALLDPSTGGSLTVEQADQLRRVWQALMLDPASPVLTTDGSITFDDVVVTLTGDSEIAITGTRQP